MNGLYMQYEVLWKVQYSVLYIVDRNHQRSVTVVVVSSDERKQVSQKALRGEPNSSTGVISSF